MKWFLTLEKIALAIALAFGCRALAGEATNAPPPVTARDFYNAGTKLLAGKKFADAERTFQAALATQDENVQPAALYNLGYTRFDDGLEALKQKPSAKEVGERGGAAAAASDRAMRQAESALAENNVQKIIAAYLAGRGAKRELRAAEEAVKAAMEAYGATLVKWQRAADDFKSAAELNPADANATHNAEIVERAIAKLVDQLRQMQQMAAKLAGLRAQMNAQLSKMKGMIPKENAPPGAAGDDDEDDQGTQPDELAGQKENPSHEGGQMEMPLSPDVAGELLDGLSIDGTRRLPMMSDKEGTPKKDKKGRDW